MVPPVSYIRIYCSLKCIDPYVDDDGECSLDTDGDSTPDYKVSTAMDLSWHNYMHNCLLTIYQKLIQVTI